MFEILCSIFCGSNMAGLHIRRKNTRKHPDFLAVTDNGPTEEQLVQEKKLMAKVPEVNLGECVECDGCVEVCPEVFRYNEVMGYIEVIDCEQYPELEVQEAINFCPTGCICWVEE